LGLVKKIVVAQPPLCDCDGVVLQANFAVVIEHWDAGGVVMPEIVRLLGKQHVVGAKLMNACSRIFLRGLVPESKVTFPRTKVSAEDAPIILQAAHPWTLARGKRVTDDAADSSPNRSDAPDARFEVTVLDRNRCCRE
jgi:hypothetical protein